MPITAKIAKTTPNPNLPKPKPESVVVTTVVPPTTKNVPIPNKVEKAPVKAPEPVKAKL